MPYTKFGSYPTDTPDGSDGWVEVPERPECPEGKEIVWWYPPGWVIRDPKPEHEDGFVWKWQQSADPPQWKKFELPKPPEANVEVTTTETPSETQPE